MAGYDPEYKFDPETQSYHMLSPSASKVAEDVMRSFQRDVEGKMRTALIGLGWVPPETAQKAQAALASALEAAVRKGVTVQWAALAVEILSAHDALANQK